MILTLNDVATRLGKMPHVIRYLLGKGYVQASARTRRGDYLFLEGDVEAVRAALVAHPPRPKGRQLGA